jgi:hypothetical protein
MSDAQNKGKGLTKLFIAVIVVGALIFIGDIFYDKKSGEKALALCGEGNVKAVITKGFFKREIACINNAG